MAGTCKRLQIAAAAKFGDDFGEKDIYILSGESFCRYDGSNLYNKGVYVASLKFGLPFLRCFRAKIKHLLNWEDFGDSNDHVHEYINAYCADTLISIGFFQRSPGFWISNSSKPFKNVEQVAVHCRTCCDTLSHFVDWFPKLRHLHLKDVDRCADTLSFPYLEHLEFVGNLNENVLDLLPANPQLKSFSVGFVHWPHNIC